MSEFREMRRKRQQLSEEESIAILQKATAGTLALLGDNDYPYAVPISYVYADGRLYFHSALSGHKVDAIRKCTRHRFVSSNRTKCIRRNTPLSFVASSHLGESTSLRTKPRSWQQPGCLGTGITPTKRKPCRKSWRMAFLEC